tara:strand:+ start:31 stop:411 length:381 start_codon:yes stop_codon:yes gene_type:complete
MGYNLNNDVPLGQLGSAYLTDGNAFKPPTDKVVIAITMVEDTAFDQLVPEVPTDSTFKGSSTGGNSDINCIGTVAPVDSNGTNADAVGGSDVFPKGLTIYGRWKTVELNNDVGAPTTCAVILYFGI